VSEAPALRANGFRDAWCGQVLGDRVDSVIRVAGWVHRRRDHGGLIFIDLRDRTGIVQLVFHPDSSGEAFALAHKLRAEDVLSAAGTVVRRSAETVNPELATGEFELAVTDADIVRADHQHAAILRRAFQIALAQHFERPIDAEILGVGLVMRRERLLFEQEFDGEAFA